MGKVTPQPDQTIHHFSHPHPLHLTNYHANQTLNLSPCSCCRAPVSGLTYFCQACNYFLHVKCSQYPQQIKHPFDPNHVFNLLPISVYPEGIFSCDACGNQGNGFSYHCKPCGVDLHLLCASMPLSITHYSHNHQLNLTFSPPYEGKIFSCDICKTNGSNHWLYRCNFCEFDAHLTCATSKPALPVHQNSFRMPEQRQPQAAARANSLPNYRPIDFGNQGRPLGVGFATPVVNRQDYNLTSQLLQSAVDPVTQQLLQAALGGGGGVDGGGTSQILQTLMGGGGGGVDGGAISQMLQTLMGGGGGGGGVDGGATSQMLQTLMGGGGGMAGGGGGASQLLQTLLGGGGAGTQLLQSFMGGNGGGGLDVGSLGGVDPGNIL